MRLFAGLALDDAARAAASAALERLRGTGFSARYQDAANLHVTLAFLGNVEPQDAAAAALALSGAAAESSPFELVFDRLGAFPYERKPRVVFIGARRQGAPFRRLAQNVRGRLARLGHRFEGDAIAHLTIARVRDSRRPLPLVEILPVVVDVRALTLFESHYDARKNASRYDAFSCVALTGSPQRDLSADE